MTCSVCGIKARKIVAAASGLAGYVGGIIIEDAALAASSFTERRKDTAGVMETNATSAPRKLEQVVVSKKRPRLADTDGSGAREVDDDDDGDLSALQHTSNEKDATESVVRSLIGMGFSDAMSRMAVKHSDGTLSDALDWAVDHPYGTGDEDGAMQETANMYSKGAEVGSRSVGSNKKMKREKVDKGVEEFVVSSDSDFL